MYVYNYIQCSSTKMCQWYLLCLHSSLVCCIWNLKLHINLIFVDTTVIDNHLNSRIHQTKETDIIIKATLELT